MAGTPDILGWIERCENQARRPICQVHIKGCLYPAPVFVAFEVKVGRDRLRPLQRAFLDKVGAAGGIAAEVREVMDAVRRLQ